MMLHMFCRIKMKSLCNYVGVNWFLIRPSFTVMFLNLKVYLFQRLNLCSMFLVMKNLILINDGDFWYGFTSLMLLFSDLARIMFLTRVFGRALCTAAKSESSAAAAASMARMGHNPLEEFFETDRSPDEDKPIVYGMLLFSHCPSVPW